MEYSRIALSGKSHTSIARCPNPSLCTYCPPTLVQIALLIALNEPEPAPRTWRAAATTIHRLFPWPHCPNTALRHMVDQYNLATAVAD